LAWAARGSIALAGMLSRAAAFLKDCMDAADRIMFERMFERKMIMRRMFLTDPRDISSRLTPEGRKVLAHWAKQCRAFNHNYAPELNAEMKGMQKMFDIILDDIFGDLPDFAQQMAEEERRAASEIVHA
jgi:hypothetical protein